MGTQCNKITVTDDAVIHVISNILMAEVNLYCCDICNYKKFTDLISFWYVLIYNTIVMYIQQRTIFDPTTDYTLHFQYCRNSNRYSYDWFKAIH